jgi:hypothetical protein
MEEAWLGYIEHRRVLKAGIKTEQTVKGIANKLKEVTPQEAVEMLNQSVTNGWRGVFQRQAPLGERPDEGFERLRRFAEKGRREGR